MRVVVPVDSLSLTFYPVPDLQSSLNKGSGPVLGTAAYSVSLSLRRLLAKGFARSESLCSSLDYIIFSSTNLIRFFSFSFRIEFASSVLYSLLPSTWFVFPSLGTMSRTSAFPHITIAQLGNLMQCYHRHSFSLRVWKAISQAASLVPHGRREGTSICG